IAIGNIDPGGITSWEKKQFGQRGRRLLNHVYPSSFSNEDSAMKKHFVLLSILLTCLACSSLAQPALENPKVKWRFKTEGPVRADAVVDGDKVFVSSTDGKLYALNKHNGQQLWKFNARGALVGEAAVSGN